MKINEAGHYEEDGETTDPLLHRKWWVGDDDDLIAFDFAVLAGRVVLHSAVQSSTLAIEEDFLYEVFESGPDAIYAADTMVVDALAFFAERGLYFKDAVAAAGFPLALRKALRDRFH